MMHKSLLNAIGNTPLVKLNFNSQAQCFAKLEYLNPGGSVKDRSALYMIEQAEKNGLLKPGGVIVDASSGNHGISVAMIGRIKNYKVIITVSEKISKEKLQTIKAYGAEVVMCPSTLFIDDPKSYHSKAVEIHKSIPGSFMPNQYFNVTNSSGHQASLGPEIWKQTEGKITHFFAGAGTCGTISGVGRFLKQQNPKIKIIAIDAANSWRATGGNPKPYKIEGIGMDFETPVFDKNAIDEIVPVSDENALPMLKELAGIHGFLVGPSSGAVAYATKEYSKKLGKDDLAVMIFGDSGRAYLTKGFYAESSDHDSYLNIKSKQDSLNI
jgi:cystathionine beta-synthase